MQRHLKFRKRICKFSKFNFESYRPKQGDTKRLTTTHLKELQNRSCRCLYLFLFKKKIKIGMIRAELFNSTSKSS